MSEEMKLNQENKVMKQVDKDSPLMIAWEKYKATADYANTKKWALFPEHVDGSLWASFLQGYEAALPTKSVDVDGLQDLINKVSEDIRIGHSFAGGSGDITYLLSRQDYNNLTKGFLILKDKYKDLEKRNGELETKLLMERDTAICTYQNVLNISDDINERSPYRVVNDIRARVDKAIIKLGGKSGLPPQENENQREG